MRKSYRVAMGGMVSALAVICMFLTGFIPFGTYALPMIAGSLLIFMALEFDFKWSYLAYLSISLLALLVTPDREAAILFISFFGHYPTTKLLIEKAGNKSLQWGLKFAVFNLAMILSFWFLITVLGLSEILDELGGPGTIGIWLFLLLGNGVFLLMDIALGRMKNYYLFVIRKKLSKHH